MLLYMILFIVIWIGVGWLITKLLTLPQGKDYRRQISKPIIVVGETVDVTLHLNPAYYEVEAHDHDVMLVIDHSSSMGSGPGSPLMEAVRAAENFIRRLSSNIYIGIIAFDHQDKLITGVTGDHKKALQGVESIVPGGATSIDKALHCAYQALKGGRVGVPKTVILLSDGGSDHKSAVAEAKRLREHGDNPTIITIGFGEYVNQDLMVQIAGNVQEAGSEKYYIHVKETEHLKELYGFLAARISGETAIEGLVNEGARAPRPFRLAKTGGLYPVGIHENDSTRIFWSIPVMDSKPVPLQYTLIPECAGWHRVAMPDSMVSWRMPDKSAMPVKGPRGPWILVLPRLLGWLWWFLNPLFWLIFGHLFCREKAEKTIEAIPSPEPLTISSFPDALPPPEESPYLPDVRPALVIGLGETGEWTLCRLKERLWDRYVDESLVDLISIQLVHPVNRQQILFGVARLDAAERVTLHQDLRPYLESLRSEGPPSTRAWIPYRQWLSEKEPLTTVHSLGGDRRKGRLSLLLKPEEVVGKIKKLLPRIREQDGIIILVCCPDDPEGSGSIMEIAHMCAENDASVTVLFTSALNLEYPPVGMLSMTRELERAVIMAGEHIFSDRGGSQVSARKLIDRLLVLAGNAENPKTAALPASELIWNMLAYREVFDEIPTVKVEDGEVICTQAELDSQIFPLRGLWNWVRARTLAMVVNGQFLGVEAHGDKMVLPPIVKESVDDYVALFWSGQGLDRPRNNLLVQGRTILTAPVAVNALLALQTELPVSELYETQRKYCVRERRLFVDYLEEWSHRVLEKENKNNTWGLPTFVIALRQLESDFQLLLEKINQMSGNKIFAEMVSFSSSLLMEFLPVLSHLRSQATDWIGVVTGPSTELDTPGPLDERTPLCYQLEHSRRETEESLIMVHPNSDGFRNRIFDKWYQDYSQTFLDQISFRVTWQPEKGEYSLRLRLSGQEYISTDELTESLRNTLDKYQNIVTKWASDDWLEEMEITQPAERFLVGKKAMEGYPKCDRVVHEHDPFIAVGIGLKNVPLDRALGVVQVAPIGLPFAWPEEANAERIAIKIQNRLQRSPETFPPPVIHLMRDTAILYGFFADLAEENLVLEGPKFKLNRDGKKYTVGPTSDALNGLETFFDVVRQVVSFQTSLSNDPLPLREKDWIVSPNDALDQIKRHPLVMEAMSFPEWEVWEDVIRGVTLEHGSNI